MKVEIVENSHIIKDALIFVDLPGSESLSLTWSEGFSQVESKEINKSISALGSIIVSLSKNSQYLSMKGINEKTSNIKRNNFGSKISYRYSKLIEILS